MKKVITENETTTTANVMKSRFLNNIKSERKRSNTEVINESSEKEKRSIEKSFNKRLKKSENEIKIQSFTAVNLSTKKISSTVKDQLSKFMITHIQKRVEETIVRANKFKIKRKQTKKNSITTSKKDKIITTSTNEITTTSHMKKSARSAEFVTARTSIIEQLRQKYEEMNEIENASSSNFFDHDKMISIIAKDLKKTRKQLFLSSIFSHSSSDFSLKLEFNDEFEETKMKLINK